MILENYYSIFDGFKNRIFTKYKVNLRKVEALIWKTPVNSTKNKNNVGIILISDSL